MAQLPTVSREQLRQVRSAAQGNAYETPFAKHALVESISRNMLTAEVTGRDPVRYAQAAIGSFQRTGGGPEIRNMLESRAGTSEDGGAALHIASAVEAQTQAAKTAKDQVTFGNQIGAAWDLYTGTNAIMGMVQEWENDFEEDRDFDYSEHQSAIEDGLSWSAVKHIRENAKSLEHAQYLRSQQEDYAEQERILNIHGPGRAVMASLLGSVADPVGIAAGFGAMKAAHVVGVGARAAFVAGNTARGVAYSGLEAAAGNLAIEAILDVSGRRVDAGDYIMAAGMGTAFGVALSPLAARGARAEGVRLAGERMQREAAEGEAELYETAVRNLGPDVTADKLDAEITRLYAKEGQRLADIRMAKPYEEDSWLSQADLLADFRSDGTAARAPDAELRGAEDAVDEAIGTARLRLEEDTQALANAEARGDPDLILRAQEDLAESEVLYRQASRQRTTDFTDEAETGRAQDTTVTDYDREVGVDGMMRTDPARAKYLSEMYASSESWVAKNPVDEARLADLYSRMGRMAPVLASTGQQLLRSQHPVLRKFVGTVLESTTGASGRRSSAAIDKFMMERLYFTELEKLPHLQSLYRRRNGTGPVSEFLSRKNTQQFNRDLTQYMNALLYNRELPEVAPEVRVAARAFERFYDKPRMDMQRVGAPGAEGMPSNSRGYFPRKFRPEAIQGMSNSQRRALTGEYSRQLNLLWDNVAMADRVAAQIVEHARIASLGGVEIPANVYSKSAVPLLREAIAKSGVGEARLSDAEIDKLVKRITNKAPQYTKKRLELDIDSTIRDPETGEQFSMLDFYETDQMKLALNYGRRTSGEIALAKYGIMGDEGLALIRDSMSIGKDGVRLSGQALDDAKAAFDQVAAEMMGRPYGKSDWFRTADNLRMLVASTRLGGMAFTQLGESANAVPALGVSHALSSVKSMPRLLAELRSGKPNPMLSSIENISGEIGTEYKVNFPFQNLDDTFVHGAEQMGTFTKVVRTTANAVPHLNGWHYVHAVQVRGMAEEILHKTMKQAKGAKADMTMLNDMGITQQMVDNLRDNLDAVAKFDAKGKMTEFDIMGMSDPKLAHDFAQAINRGAKQIIQGSFVGETGKWAHNDLLRILFQFRTFSIQSQEKQWTRVAAAKGAFKTFGFMVGAMSWALPIHFARIQINALGREDRKEYVESQLDPLVLGRALFNYGALTGLSSDMFDVGIAGLGTFEGVTGTNIDIDRSNVRGISDGDIAGVIPAAGYVNQLMRSVTSGDVDALLRMFPGSNIPYLVPLFNATKESDKAGDDVRDF